MDTMNIAVNIILTIGAVLLFLTGLQIAGYFAKGKAKWAVWGVLIYYWAMYAAGWFLLFFAGSACLDHRYCNIGSIGGLILLGLSASAIIFYEVTIYSYTSLIRKLKKLGFSDQFSDKIRLQHTRAVIVFFFTTWVAAGFVYLIHHKAGLIINKALNESENTDRKALEAELNIVFARQIDWRKKKC